MMRVVLVGCGAMGFAMLRGWRSAAAAPEIHVVEPVDALRDRAADAGAVVCESAAGLPGSPAPDLIFFAVKPQDMAAAAPAYAHFAAAGAVCVSGAAGVRLARLKEMLGAAAIIRCMPNTPASVGAGMMVCCAHEAVGDSDRRQAETLLSACGAVAWVEREDLMDAVTAISGSGPAYVFYFIECLAAAAEKLGIPADLSVRLARQTVDGAGRLAAMEEGDLTALRREVTSPGGATAAALAVLEEGDGFARLVESAARAARDRSAKLGDS